MRYQVFFRRAAICAIELLPFFLAFYLVRFRLVIFPTTFLEGYLAVFFILFTLGFGFSGWRDGWRRLGAWHGPVMAWFVVSLVAVFVSPDRIAGFGLWRAYILEPLLLFVTLPVVLADLQSRERARRNLFLSILPWAVWALIQFTTGRFIPHPWDVSILLGRRATGPFPFPNALALYAAPIGAWAFAVWMRNRRQWIVCISWIAALVAIALAKSEGGFIAFATVAWLCLLAHRPWRRVVSGATFLMVACVALIQPLRTVVLREVTFHGWSGQVRLFQWRETRQMLHDHWFWGAGLAGYSIVFKPYHHATAIEIFQYPHTIILNFWAETGLLGLISFFWIVGIWIWIAYKRIDKRKRLSEGEHIGSPLPDILCGLAPLLAILIHGIVDVPYFKNDLALMFWLMVFLALPPQGSTDKARPTSIRDKA